MITIEQIRELSKRVDDLARFLDIDSKRKQIDQAQKESLASDFWDDPKRAETHQRAAAGVKSWVDMYDKVASLVGDLELMPDFLKEGAVSETEVDAHYGDTLESIEALELRNMMQGEEDGLSAIIEINSGAGGTEALDWASMLMRMYVRWAERRGYKIKVLDLQDGDPVGVKSAMLEIDGEFAYGYLQSENGVHRLVRPSPFNAGNKRQTTFASVFVTPSVDDTIEIVVNPAYISWDTYRSGGAGGQNVNKVETAVRLKYKSPEMDSEMVIENSETRSQLNNKENALRILKSKLYQIELEKRRTIQNQLQGTKKKIEWGSQIRSYVLDDRRVKDHRTNEQTSDCDAVLDGDLDKFIKAFLMQA